MDNSNTVNEVNYSFVVRKNLPFIFIFTLFFFISAINIPIIVTLWRHGFDDGTYSHAFIIPFISLYLYFKLNDINKLKFRERPSLCFLTCLVLSAITFYLMNTAQISIGYWFSSLLLLTLTVLALFRFNWYVVFPAFYLIFIFPFWGSLIGLLQDMSVTSVEYMMSFTGIPTYVEAQYVSIPAGTFEIANGCSGLRYFIVSLSISSLYIFLFINNIKRAGIFFLFAILGGLITNWLRITILVIIGHQTDMTHSLMNDHNSFGWYVYLPFMLLLFMLGNKLKDHDLLDSAPLQNSSLVKTVGAPNYPTLIILVLVLFSSSTLLHNVINNQVADDKKPYHLSSLSPKIFNYSHIETVQLPNFSLDSVYNIYSYDSKDLDSKPTYFENTYLAKGWDIESDISTNEWNIYIVRKNTKRAIMAYSFQLNNFRTSSSKSFKIERLKTAFSNPGNPTLHWLYTPCLSRCVSESKKVSYYLESASLTK